MAHLKGTLDALRPRDVRRDAAHPAAAVVLPVHRAVGRGRRVVPGEEGRRRLGRVGRLRDGQPERAAGLRHRPRGLLRLRLRHGHRADPACSATASPTCATWSRATSGSAAPSASEIQETTGASSPVLARRARGRPAHRPRRRRRGRRGVRPRRPGGRGDPPRPRADRPARRRPGRGDRGADRAQEADPLLPGRPRGRRRAAAASSAAPATSPSATSSSSPARRRAARRLRDRRAQDLRARLRRHDRLGARAGHRRRPRRHPRAPARLGGARRGRTRAARPGRRGGRAGRHAGPRLLLLGARAGPRAGAARSTPTSPTRSSRVEVPAADGDAWPVDARRPAAAPGSSPGGSTASTRRADARGGCSGGCSPPGCGRSRWSSTSPTT